MLLRPGYRLGGTEHQGAFLIRAKAMTKRDVLLTKLLADGRQKYGLVDINSAYNVLL